MNTMTETTTRVDVGRWVRDLLARSPKEVEAVWTFPDYRCDVVVVALTRDCYDVRPSREGLHGDEAVQKDQIEQRITFDPALKFDNLNVFFLRPDRFEWGCWDWGPGEPPAEILNEPDEDIRWSSLNGFPYGPMDRYHREFRYADRLYPPYPSQQEGQDAVTKMGAAWVEAYVRKLVADLSPAHREVFIKCVNDQPEKGRRQGEMPPFALERCKPG
jgi:hypothetical protein